MDNAPAQRPASWSALVGRVRSWQTRRSGKDLEQQMPSALRAGLAPSQAGNVGGFLNDGGGDLVISRFRPALERLEYEPIGPCELVASDLGPMWFPRFDRFIRPAIVATGSWEREEIEFLRERVADGATVVNVGANVGYVSLALSRMVGPAGRVVALEPETLNYRLLCANLAANGAANVLPIHTAAGEFNGSIALHRSPDNAGDHRTAPHPVSVGAVQVPVVALDALIPDTTQVDAVISDAQGYDHRIVAGMADLLRRWQPLLMVEFWPSGILELGDDPAAVLAGYTTLGRRMIVVTTGEDVTDRTATDVIGIALDGRDHVTLALVP